MILILDEWIIHDLRGDNGEDKQKESYKFLETIKQKCDKIVILENSAFYKKILKFFKNVSKLKVFERKIAKILSSFLLNSQKTLKINQLSIGNLEESKEELKNILEKIKHDDHYIVKAYYYLKQLECLIITTDNPLLNILNNYNIQCSYRDNFLESYLKNK